MDMQRDVSGINMTICEGDTNETQMDKEEQPEMDLGNATSNLTLSVGNQVTQNSRPYFIQHTATLRIMNKLRNVLEHQCCESDVKLLAFAAAAHYDGYDTTLVPVPSILMSDSFFDIYGLRRLISSWPSCTQMLKRLKWSDSFSQFVEAGAGYIHLLLWVLVWQAYPNLERIDRRQLSRLCKKVHLKGLSRRPSVILRVSDRWDNDSSMSSGRYAYFCCPLHFLYRLLIMRDMPSPIRLHDHPETALAECPVSSPNGWTHSRFGRSPRCLIICELMADEQLLLQNDTPRPLVVYDPSCVHLRYLLLFAEFDRANRSLTLKSIEQRQGFIRLVRWLKQQARILVYGNY